MESATILTPPRTGLIGVLCFPSEPNIPEGSENEKNINTISMYVFRIKLENGVDPDQMDSQEAS